MMLARAKPPHEKAGPARAGPRANRAQPPVQPTAQLRPMIQRKCACGGGCPDCEKKLPLQAKLTVGSPNDRYEREADRVAEQIMRMPKPHLQPRSNLSVQRVAAGGLEHVDAPSVVHDALHSPSQPLDRSTRAFFESRFGHDFSGVRVHTEPKAAESAKAVNALAYTVGNDLVFGQGQFAPGTTAGKRMIAHELTHVVQQAAIGGAARVNSSASMSIVQRQDAPSSLDEKAKSIIRIAQKRSSGREIDAFNVVWKLIKAYYPSEAFRVHGVGWKGNMQGLRAEVSKTGETTIWVGNEFLDSVSEQTLEKRKADVGRELTKLRIAVEDLPGPVTPYSCPPSVQDPIWNVANKPILRNLPKCNFALAIKPEEEITQFGQFGMGFKGKIRVAPHCPGRVYFVQYIKPETQGVFCAANTTLSLCAGFPWVIDNHWPGPGSNASIDRGEPSEIPLLKVDLPSKSLSGSGSRVQLARVCVEHEFVTYIVYDDENGNLTPLGWMHWWWNGIASRDAGTCPLNTSTPDCAGWKLKGSGEKRGESFNEGTMGPQPLDRSVEVKKPSDLKAEPCSPDSCSVPR